MTSRGRVAAVLIAAVVSGLAALAALPAAGATPEPPPSHTSHGGGADLGTFALFGDAGVLRSGVVLGDAGVGVPAPLDRRYPIGSLSKQLAAAAVLRLNAEGRLDLDAPLTAYLGPLSSPWLPSGALACTARQLLGHRCGLRELPGDASRHLGHLSHRWMEAALIREIQLAGLQSAPGDRFAYSNLGYDLLGVLVSEVSGEGYGAYLARAIFDPLGMGDTSAGIEDLGPAEEVTDAVLPLFGLELGMSRLTLRGRETASAFGASGDVVSSARDLITWTTALHGGRALPEAQYRQMVSMGAEGYGLGLGTLHTSQGSLIGHTGSLEPFGYNSFLAYDPARGEGVVVLANAARRSLDAMAVGRALLRGEADPGAAPGARASGSALPPVAMALITWLALPYLLFQLIRAATSAASGPLAWAATSVSLYCACLWILCSFRLPGPAAGIAAALALPLLAGIARRWRSGVTHDPGARGRSEAIVAVALCAFLLWGISLPALGIFGIVAAVVGVAALSEARGS